MKNQNKNQKNLESAIEAFKKEALAINGAGEELERVWIRVACDEDYRFTSEVLSSIQNWVKELHPVEAFKAEARAFRMLGYEIGKVWTLFARDEYDHFSGAVEDDLVNWVENELYAYNNLNKGPTMNTNNTTIATVNHIPTSADDIQVGDIFYTSKTYNSTWVNFYQVVSRTKKTFTLKEMKAERNWDDIFGSTGTSLPTTSLSEREYKARIHKDGSTKLIVRGYCGKGTAYPWDGSPEYISND